MAFFCFLLNFGGILGIYCSYYHYCVLGVDEFLGVFDVKRKHYPCIYLFDLCYCLLFLYVSTVWRGVLVDIDTFGSIVDCIIDTVCVRLHVRRFGLTRLLFLEILHEYALNMGLNGHRQFCWSQKRGPKALQRQESDTSTVWILAETSRITSCIFCIFALFSSRSPSC